MTDNSGITIRNASVDDVPNLQKFFIKVYGNDTVFQDRKFLLYYFNADNSSPLSGSTIALNNEGEIVAHYGGLKYYLKKGDKQIPLMWLVNAFTLPEIRDRNINMKMINFLIAQNDINGAIGISNKSARFYNLLKYNVFNFMQLSRHIWVLDEDKTREVSKYIGQDAGVLTKNHRAINKTDDAVVVLDKDNFYALSLDMDADFENTYTSRRNKDFLLWRFISNPYIRYKVYGYIKDGKLVTYAALREEVLQPLGYKVNRMIDLYGKPAHVPALMDKIILDSVSNNHIYIDFAKFGNIYTAELKEYGFIHLENDDCGILPQITSPIEYRPNCEYVMLQSNIEEIKNLQRDDMYFTRMDADRDRPAKIFQIGA